MNFASMPTVAPPNGFYPGIADTEYFRWAAWSQSTLKHFGEWENGSEVCAGSLVAGPYKSPAHALERLQKSSKSTPEQRFGTAFHRLLLEPQRFVKGYTHIPEKLDRRTNAGKADWANLVKLYGEDAILEREDWDTLQAMAAAAACHRQARMLIGSMGECECSMVWTDAKTGGVCKGRLDKRTISTDGRHFIIDLKTTKCAHWRMFEKDVAAYGYHIQAAMYCDGYAALHGGVMPEYFLIAQETAAPYPVIVYRMPEEVIASGRTVYRAQLALAEECVRTGNFPGYADSRVVDMTLPAWAVADEPEPVA